MRMPSLAHAMTPVPFTIATTDSVLVAHRMMSNHGIRHLPVTKNGKLVGVLSERDVMTWSANGTDVKAGEAMTDEPFVVSLDTPLGRVARQMAERKVGSAVVMEEERIVGVFTTVDALRVLAEVLDGG